MKVCINGQGHMTKMAAMELFKVCINHETGMTLTFLWQGQPRLSKHLNGENCYNVI